MKQGLSISTLTSLLHLSDPTLPIGGYAHSYGLESYVQSGVVASVDSAKEFIRNSLCHNIRYNDALYVRLAWQASERGDLSGLCILDDELTALKSPREIRQASLKLGVRLLKIFSRKLRGDEIEALESLVRGRDGVAGGHYPIIYGVLSQLLELPLDDTLLSFYYNTMVCMVTNAVKLIPLGQLSGQDILFELEGELEGLVSETIEMNEDMRGVCAVGFDRASMEHEHLYSRLYMS
ncbi:MAG: urease accessory protein UreF [Rikenellaceae bacterium]